MIKHKGHTFPEYVMLQSEKEMKEKSKGLGGSPPPNRKYFRLIDPISKKELHFHNEYEYFNERNMATYNVAPLDDRGTIEWTINMPFLDFMNFVKDIELSQKDPLLLHDMDGFRGSPLDGDGPEHTYSLLVRYTDIQNSIATIICREVNNFDFIRAVKYTTIQL